MRQSVTITPDYETSNFSDFKERCTDWCKRVFAYILCGVSFLTFILGAVVTGLAAQAYRKELESDKLVGVHGLEMSYTEVFGLMFIIFGSVTLVLSICGCITARFKTAFTALFVITIGVVMGIAFLVVGYLAGGTGGVSD